MFWIVGASGLLGSTLCLHKEALGNHIATGHEIDISKKDIVFSFAKERPGITHIMNAAAFSLVDAAETEKDQAFLANVRGPENLSLLAKEIGAKLIHISTDYVFPGTIHRPLSETDVTAPCNYYGKTKLEGEMRLSSQDLILRTSWIFGGGGKNFVAKLFKMLMSQKEIQLTDDQWGRPTYAPDLADAIFQMLDQSGLYHFANRGVATKYEFGVAMKEMALELGFPVITEHLRKVSTSSFSSLCTRPVYSAFDTTKIEKQLQIRHWHAAMRDFLCAQLPAYL